MRQLFIDQGSVQTKLLRGKEAEGAKFRDYFDGQEPVSILKQQQQRHQNVI